MTDRNELVARAKAMISAHSEFVIKIGGKVISSGMMPELVARIEQDAATIARLEGERDAMFRRAHLAEEWRDHDKERAEAAEATAARLRAELDEARGALRLLHGAVCGDTGFAACVRIDAGRAYPWPALDVAEEAAAAILAKIDGGQ